MKLSKKLTKDLKETLKEPDGLYVWISIEDAGKILKLIELNRIMRIAKVLNHKL